jgi:thiol:disulfide interchange protein DsbC
VKKTHLLACVVSLIAIGSSALSQEAVIRKNLSERVPNYGVAIEISPSDVPGVYEVRIGNDIIYTDAQANYIFLGKLIDIRAKVNVTDARIAGFNTVKFADLAMEDAVTYVKGNGRRKLAVFVDPNCNFCKTFDRDLQRLSDITVSVFLYPVLGQDSLAKSKNIWCSPERSKAWSEWMINSKAAATAKSDCETAAIFRTLEYGKMNGVRGTPTLIFEDNSKHSGAMDMRALEKRLASIKPTP